MPSLIFLGVGAMTDFGPLIANPNSFLMGAAAQFGIYACILPCNFPGIQRTKQQQQSPSSVVLTARLPFSLQVSLDRLQSHGTDRSSSIFLYVPGSDHPASDHEASHNRGREKDQDGAASSGYPSWRRSFSRSLSTIVVCLILPTTAPLVGMLMLGNLFRESGVVRQLTETASNALMYIVVILLGTSVGATTSAEAFLNARYTEDRSSWSDRLHAFGTAAWCSASVS